MQLPFSLQPVLDFVGQFVGGPGYAFILLAGLAKIALILGGTLTAVPFIVLFERKIIGWSQDRPGPNRAGPGGVLQGFLDGIKLFFKEEITPKMVDRPLFLLAPFMVVVPAFVALCIVPIGPMIQGAHLDALAAFLQLDPTVVGSAGQVKTIAMAITNPNIGILYVLAITSMGVYGITLAGWASNNKWSLLGGIRASAQMISYEIVLSLSIIGVLLLTGSLNLYDIIDGQKGGFWNWNIMAQPVAFILFVLAMFAETNRLPFDMAEAEPELTGGFHTEYSSMRFALFFMGEYINIIIVSAICCTLFLGGYGGLIGLDWAALEAQHGLIAAIGYYALGPVLLPLKIAGFIFFFIWTRATLPRLRYDQLMNLGWKFLLPVGLINLFLTAVVVAIDLAMDAGKDEVSVSLPARLALGAVTLALFISWDVFIYSPRRKKQLASEYRGLSQKEEESDPALAS
jgi:NADH-quinone oxidoreductase subunit H